MVDVESRRAHQRVVARLVERGAQGMVLGCTEIELLLGPGDVDVPVFPTTRLHIEAAVDAATGAGHPRDRRRLAPCSSRAGAYACWRS